MIRFALHVTVLFLVIGGFVACDRPEEPLKSKVARLYDERLQRCSREFDRFFCQVPEGAPKYAALMHDILVKNVMRKYPESGTCSIHGPFFLCTASDDSPIGPMTHDVLYRVGKSTWSDNRLWVEWSRKVTLSRDTVDPRGPKK